MDDLSERLVELAPLTRSFACNLSNYLKKSLPRREAGRPRREEGDAIERAEKQMFEAMDQLLLLIQANREQIYNLLDTVARSGELNEKSFLQTLNTFMPNNMTAHQQRLKEWSKKKLLFYDVPGLINPQCASRFLLARIIDPNRTGWLPPQPPKIESLRYWRHDVPALLPVPYEMPLVLLDDTTDSLVYKARPEPSPTPYILSSPWKGVAWDDPAWVVFDDGAARWVGDPTSEILDQWVSPEERASLLPSNEGMTESPTTQTLRLIMAKRFRHDIASRNETSNE